ncbi:hypothetical protein M422DRAFT_163863, partial [Sphaerobolus stellatus SS14]
LEMSYVASRSRSSFTGDLFVIWREDNAEKLILRCRVIGGMGEKDEDGLSSIEEDVFLRQLESTMLDAVDLRGVKDIRRGFLVKHDNVATTKEGKLEPKGDQERV